MAIDKDAIREHVRGILAALGDDPDREGLKETPDRVARMYEEVFEGMNYTNHEIAMMFNKSFKDDLPSMRDRPARAASSRRCRAKPKANRKTISPSRTRQRSRA